MPLIDSHAHLDFAEYDDDLALVLERAKEAGVDKIINIGADLKRSKKAVNLGDRFDNIWSTIGLHPEADGIDLEEAKKELADLLSLSTKIVAIGECGLDYFYEQFKESEQIALFEMQIFLAKKYKLPLVIHLRNGQDDQAAETGYQLLLKNKVTTGVIHCFTLEKKWVKKFIDLGLYLGYTGIVTYKNAEAVRDSVVETPLERLLVETDCPYLAPQKYRGERNEPAHVIEIAKKIAEIKNLSYQTVATETTKNTEKLFNI